MSHPKTTKEKTSEALSRKSRKRLNVLLWIFALGPLFAFILLFMFQSEEDLPPVSMLDDPPELLASIVFADDGKTELGRYWKVNRTNTTYNELSPYLTDALISTEDERYYEHSGIDFRALARAIFKMGKAGGASTITQQLAKQLFTIQAREEIHDENEESAGPSSKMGRIFRRLDEKVRENIIAKRLEERYTKEEIITMYLNQFDFLYNAVGVENAARVYYNKEPKDLTKAEAAMLIGMCKNPSLFNPHTYQVKDYRSWLAARQGVPAEKVSQKDIREARSNDSLRAAERRNQVLFQWLRNSEKNNSALRVKISREEYEKLKTEPIVTDYQVVDHKRGMAPYFRESLRKEVSKILSEKKEDGSLKFKKKDGSKYNIYQDGLRIYTTIDVNLQDHAEKAVEMHLKKNLQPKFDENNKHMKRFPFSNAISEEDVERLITSAMHRSDRYKSLVRAGLSEGEIRKNFSLPTNMRIFSWQGEIDTIMSPMDSIRYYKSYLQAGLVSIEPSTGFVKAWVGGINIDHFAYDHVRQGKRQVGSTIKPFVYASGITMNVIKPGLVIPDVRYCVDLFGPDGNPNGKQWCPSNSGGKSGGSVSISKGLALSKNNVATYVMSRMGAKAGPQTVAKIMRGLNIDLRDEDIVPAMCLGSMDLSLYELVGAQASFVNRGIFNQPTAILRIEDRNGNVIYNAPAVSREVMNEHVAYTVLKMMRGVVDGGTGNRLRWAEGYGGIKYPTAGKTGTTQNNSDGWFMGLTPDLVTGVWVGAEDRSVHFRWTADGQGARTAMPIYGYYMNGVYADKRIKISTGEFEMPEGYDNSVFDLTGREFILDLPDSLNGNGILNF
ncbi:MAG: penicillin-binding protein [Bacteroidetes bacterium]|nr:MAG: penicillin-binding protein [Bacteroidota bacterium]